MEKREDKTTATANMMNDYEPSSMEKEIQYTCRRMKQNGMESLVIGMNMETSRLLWMGSETGMQFLNLRMELVTEFYKYCKEKYEKLKEVTAIPVSSVSRQDKQKEETRNLMKCAFCTKWVFEKYMVKHVETKHRKESDITKGDNYDKSIINVVKAENVQREKEVLDLVKENVETVHFRIEEDQVSGKINEGDNSFIGQNDLEMEDLFESIVGGEEFEITTKGENSDRINEKPLTELNSDTYVCAICDSKFSSLEILQKHFLHDHEQNSDFVCSDLITENDDDEICDVEGRDSMKEDNEVDSEDKGIQMKVVTVEELGNGNTIFNELCNKKFTNDSNEYMETDTLPVKNLSITDTNFNPKRHVYCEICNVKICKKGLKTHMNSKHGGGVVSSKHFESRWKVSCKFCDSIVWKTQLNRHMEQNHSYKHFDPDLHVFCKICKLKVWKSGLKKHMLKHGDPADDGSMEKCDAVEPNTDSSNQILKEKGNSSEIIESSKDLEKGNSSEIIKSSKDLEKRNSSEIMESSNMDLRSKHKMTTSSGGESKVNEADDMAVMEENMEEDELQKNDEQESLKGKGKRKRKLSKKFQGFKVSTKYLGLKAKMEVEKIEKTSKEENMEEKFQKDSSSGVTGSSSESERECSSNIHFKSPSSDQLVSRSDDQTGSGPKDNKAGSDQTGSGPKDNKAGSDQTGSGPKDSKVGSDQIGSDHCYNETGSQKGTGTDENILEKEKIPKYERNGSDIKCIFCAQWMHENSIHRHMKTKHSIESKAVRVGRAIYYVPVDDETEYDIHCVDKENVVYKNDDKVTGKEDEGSGVKSESVDTGQIQEVPTYERNGSDIKCIFCGKWMHEKSIHRHVRARHVGESRAIQVGRAIHYIPVDRNTSFDASCVDIEKQQENNETEGSGNDNDRDRISKHNSDNPEVDVGDTEGGPSLVIDDDMVDISHDKGRNSKQKQRKSDSVDNSTSDPEIYTNCKICNRKIKKIFLKRHLKVTHNISNSWTCDICSFECKSNHHLRSHRFNAHGSKGRNSKQKQRKSDSVNNSNSHPEIYTNCKICNRKIKKIFLKRHLKVTHNISNSWTCDICSFECKSNHHLRSHRINAHGSNFTCDVCGRRFKRSLHFENHKKMHENTDFVVHHLKEKNVRFHRYINCEICGQELYFLAYKSHLVRIHNQAYEFSCNVCQQKFTKREDWKKHRSDHRKPVPPKLEKSDFMCEYCGKTFKRLYSLTLHRRTTHCSESERVKCDLCGITVKNSKRLQIHKDKTHITIFAHQCHICGRQFKHIGSLASHIETHDNSSFLHKCDYCETKFRTGEGSREHMLRVHPELVNLDEFKLKYKVYTCEYCGRLFGLKGSYTRHVRYHTGSKPFSCDFCDLSFYDVNSLNRHRNKRHLGKVELTTCVICNIAYRERTKYRKHLKSQKHAEALKQCGMTAEEYEKTYPIVMKRRPLFKGDDTDMNSVVTKKRVKPQPELTEENIEIEYITSITDDEFLSSDAPIIVQVPEGVSSFMLPIHTSTSDDINTVDLESVDAVSGLLSLR